MSLTTEETSELDLRKRQLAARTVDGKASKGYKNNVDALNRRIAELEAKDAA